MERVQDKFSGVSECGAFLELGSILRVVGEYSNADNPEINATEPVLFLSCPFLTLQTNANRGAPREEYRPRTLLESLYGYDVGSERESVQVVQKLGASKSSKDMLHIDQLWCLLVGSSVLITISNKSAAEIRGNSIVTDSRTSGNREPLLIRLTDMRDRKFHVVIERDYNYADFLTYAVALVAGQDADPSGYELFGKNQQMLRPAKWVQILGSSDSQVHTFSIKPRNEEFEGRSDTGREGSVAGYSRSRSVPRPSPSYPKYKSRSTGPDNSYRQPDHFSRSQPRNHEAVSRDYYGSSRNRSQERERVRARYEPFGQPTSLSHGDSDPAPELGEHRSLEDMYYIPPRSQKLQPQFPGSREAGEDLSRIEQWSTNDTLDQIDTTASFSDEKDTLYDTETRGWIRHSPKSLSPIEERSTSSSSPRSGGHSENTGEKSSNDQVPSSQQDNGRTTVSTEPRAPSSGEEPGTQNMQREILSEVPGAILDSHAEALDPSTTISIAEPWRKYAQNTEQHKDFPSRNTLPSHLFRYVEPGSYRPSTGEGGGQHSRGDSDMVRKQPRPDRELEPEEAPVEGNRSQLWEVDTGGDTPLQVEQVRSVREEEVGLSLLSPISVTPPDESSRPVYHVRSSDPAIPSGGHLVKARPPRYAEAGFYSNQLRNRPSRDSRFSSNYNMALGDTFKRPRVAGSGPASLVLNGPSPAKTTPPQVYDLGDGADEEEGSDTDTSVPNSSDASSENMNRNTSSHATVSFVT